MSCLTKKSLFCLVLSIVCNSTLSDKTEECIANLHEVFLRYMPPWFYFKLAMVLMSQSVIESIKSPDELINYFQNHEIAFFQYSDEDTSSHPNESPWYFRFFGKMHEIDSAFNHTNYNTSWETKQQYIIGYFKSLVCKLHKIDKFINEIALSPKQFCGEYDENESPLCRKALYAMLRLREADPHIEIDEMKGYNALMRCYLNYTYVDFTTDEFFLKLKSSDGDDYQNTQKEISESDTNDSGSGVYQDESFQQFQIEFSELGTNRNESGMNQDESVEKLQIKKEFSESGTNRSESSMNQDESVEKLQISIVTKYFRHMFHVSTKIVELNENKGFKLFPTVVEYCRHIYNV